MAIETSERVPRGVTMRERIRTLAYWTLPSLFCLALYWQGLTIWFLHDDFAWLSLRFQVHDWPSLLRAVFTPAEHGTFRPLSERGFFLLLTALFGVQPLPFRICVFLTQFANLVLVSSIAGRLTGSKLAGFLAPVFWVSNTVLVVAMTWSSAYMQVLCGFLLLLAFHFFLRYIETGRRRYLYWQWAPFLTGFLVMESIIVYPALAAAYALLCARKHFIKTLPLFVPSVVFTILHMILAPKQAAGTYSIHLDASMGFTLWTYWRWIYEPFALAFHVQSPLRWLLYVSTVVFSAALLGFAGWMAWRGRRVPLFFLGWFVILLAPVLPLRDHISNYYLTLPSIGVASLGAAAVGFAFSRQGKLVWTWRVVAIVLTGFFLMISVPETRGVTRWWHQRARRVRNMTLGVAEARQLHPRETILLVGVDDTLFWGGILDGCFRAVGVSDVFLEPGTEQRTESRPALGNVERFILPSQAILRGLSENQIVVYEVRDRLVNITRRYHQTAARRLVDKLPARVDAGNPLTAYLFGGTWYGIDGGYRWMPRRATLRLRGPDAPGRTLSIQGFCPRRQLDAGPLSFFVTVDGTRMPASKITRGDAQFTFEYPLPASATGKPEIEIALESERVIVPGGDGSELSLVFGVFEIR
jgi:hypothetical protein